MIPKMHWRKIGDVNIFELEGVFSDPWLGRPKEEITGLLGRNPSNALLVNLRMLERVDRPGAELILENVRKVSKGGILGRNLSSSFVAESMDPNESIPIFEKGNEAITYFGKELAQAPAASVIRQEKRSFPRLKTALAAEFEWTDEGGVFSFEVVVLNLSEGGFYGRFLDSKTEELASRKLDPFDLKLLSVHLTLEPNEILEIGGKILRKEKEESELGGVAIGFYNIQTEDHEKIKACLEAQQLCK